MKAFIDQHRETYGVEPICKVLPIAPSTYRLHAAWQAEPTRRSERAQRDERLCEEIQRVFEGKLWFFGISHGSRFLQIKQLGASMGIGLLMKGPEQSMLIPSREGF